MHVQAVDVFIRVANKVKSSLKTATSQKSVFDMLTIEYWGQHLRRNPIDAECLPFDLAD